MGEVFNESALPALAPRAAEPGTALDGVILAAHRHRPAVDLANAGNIGRRCEREQIAGVVIFGTAGEFADFLKAVGVEQSIDALADRQLAGGVMARHRFGASALLGQRAAPFDVVDFCRPAHGTPGLARCARGSSAWRKGGGDGPPKMKGYPSVRPLLLSIRLLTI